MQFIRNYVDSLAGLECPPSYHFFSCLSMISCLVGKQVWSIHGSIKTYPNVLTCLIGEAGSGKTTAMGLARKVLRQVPGIAFAKKCPSAQELMLCCQKSQRTFKHQGKELMHSPIALFLSELSNFIQLSPELMIPFLTDAYDDDVFDYGTKTAGECIIQEPVLGGVVCCTHEWITRMQSIINFNDGIGRRFLWVMDKGLKREDWPEGDVPVGIVARCVEISKLIGEFQWPEDVRRWWKGWYHKYDRAGGSVTKSYFSTKHIHLMKIAMLIAMSDRLELTYRVSDFEEGLEILKLMEKGLEKVFEGIGRNQLNPVANRVVEVITQHGNGGVPERILRQLIFSSANVKEMDEVIGHLVTTQQIVKRGNVFDLAPKKGSHEQESLEKVGDSSQGQAAE